MYNSKRYNKECEVCGKQVDIYPRSWNTWQFKGSTRKEFYCSYKCMTIADSKKNLQIKHK